MSIENENHRDPRNRLLREKYFSLRPKPLERWLWTQGIPASAERVFWLHWQEGLQRGDWCSELPLRRVARECNLDVSTVTRAYQLLSKFGCIRRTDPGRDPANPFQQAVALTEVRLPRDLVMELDRHPSRRTAQSPEVGLRQHRMPDEPVAAPTPETSPPRLQDPLAGLSGRERVRALSELTQDMSSDERHRYQEAIRLHRAEMIFDANSKLSDEARATVLGVLASMVRPSASLQHIESPHPQIGTADVRRNRRVRRLSVFELARLRRDLGKIVATAEVPELLRQVVWSIETGALRRFDTLHAVHIALKKIREGAWTRPNRMPPNWTHATCVDAVGEMCRTA